MYLNIRGGEAAIAASHRLLAQKRRGNPDLPELGVEQIGEQLSLAVDRVMSEGGLHDRQLAALALKQAQGDAIEAIFLLRATRAAFERFGTIEPLETATMLVRRRISATHRDVPGGQILGPTYDYTQRLLDLEPVAAAPPAETGEEPPARSEENDIAALWGDLVETEASTERDAARAEALENLAMSDEGFLLSLAYSTMRGFGDGDALLGEIRYGDVIVEMLIPEIGITVGIAEISVTECQSLHTDLARANGSAHFQRGYGLALGQSERKAIAMALVDHALRDPDKLGHPPFPAQNAEFVLPHADSVAASGLVQVLKLPHYVHFQGKAQLLRELRTENVPVAEDEHLS